MGEEEPRRRRPRAESAGKPRGMGAWVFMARKACTPPLPALKPNPSRSFLSGGRGDYPKGFTELLLLLVRISLHRITDDEKALDGESHPS